MILNFRQLEVFRAIIIAKTISGAAEMLHVSQPGISRLLKYMESKLGIVLFERHKGRLLPTPEALELFRELDPIYDRIEDLDLVVRRIMSNEDMEFKIACTPSLSNYLLPTLVARLVKRKPGIKIKMESFPNEIITDQIIQRRLDFAIGFHTQDHPLLLAEPAVSLKLECVVPKDHALAGRKSVSFSDIIKYPLVTYYYGTLLGTTLKKACDSLGKEPETAVVVRFANEACTLVEQGLGITIAYQHTALAQRYPTLTTIPVKGESQSLHFLRHNGIPMSNNVRELYDLAKSELRKLV
jgi:DNA-binding transcriptional LysR family regulator